MFTRLVRRQLIAFAIVAAVVTTYSLVKYVQFGRMLDLGNIHVAAEMPVAGGLYQNAIVTYNGVQVGLVHDVQPTTTGVRANLRIDNTTKIPANLTAYVRSTSPVGEQYIDLRPKGPGGPLLAEGSIIPSNEVVLPVPTDELINQVNALVQTLPQKSLNVTLDELDSAFNRSGPALGDLLTSAQRFVITAQDNLTPTLGLVDVLGPFLGTQISVAPQIQSIFSTLVPFTGQLDRSDEKFRSILKKMPGFTDQISGISDDLEDPLPMFMANLAADGEVLRVYLPHVRQALVLGPPTVAMLQSIFVDSDPSGFAKLDFTSSVNSPPYCKQGYLEKRDDTNFQGVPPPPKGDTFCQAPHDSPQVVAGARNAPCPNSAVRSAYAIDCGFDFTNPAQPASSRVTPYDPSSGRFIDPMGNFFQLGNDSTGDNPPTDSRSFLLRPLGL
jgi:phospholipid/cholesterol/gamma-HCH transport system substrate-binding protein